jgi:hypothetical protein
VGLKMRPTELVIFGSPKLKQERSHAGHSQ